MQSQNGTARYWIGTIPYESWIFPSPIPPEVAYIKGQEECGSETGYRHIQLLVVFRRPVRRTQVSKTFPGHWEKSRSAAASDYVWKEDTRVPDTQFEIGALPFKRNEKKDWDAIRSHAQEGNLQAIPSDVYIRCYNSLRRISSDNAKCVAMERTCYVFWGRTGTGKSRRAWDEAGLEAYAKDPQTKWWDGYQGEQHVVIDEFRGSISISHILRWLDRYPVRVECKGSSMPFVSSKIWITSNLDPRSWYPDIDVQTIDALIRRLNITHFAYFFNMVTNPTKKRKSSFGGAIHDEESAEKHHTVVNRKVKQDKREQKFRKKVLAAVTTKAPTGTYRVERSVTICQKLSGKADVYSDCDAGTRLEFFTPGHFKDALEILYGTKPVLTNGHVDRTGEMYDIDVPLDVVSSKVTFAFKNNSLRVSNLEMYVFRCKDRAHNYPREMLMNQLEKGEISNLIQ